MSTTQARLLAVSILGAVTTLVLPGCSKQATSAGSAVANPTTIATASISPSAAAPNSSSDNTFNFPQTSCGDRPTGANDTWYPVFLDGANLEQVQAQYCQDAVLTTREQTGQPTIQIGSFTNRDRAGAFAKVVNGEVGEPQPPTNTATSQSSTEQNNSNSRAVVDQFYHAYVLQDKSWRELQDYLDPDTYQQLSQLKGYDSDPFAATQERVFEYSIGDSRVTGNTAEVDIRFKTGVRKPVPHFGRSITVVLQNNAGQWRIKNMIYGIDSSGQPDDLLHNWMEGQKYLIINQQ